MPRFNWEDAPEWANWLAMDADGEWWWFRDKPILLEDQWLPESTRDSKQELASKAINWEETLEARHGN